MPRATGNPIIPPRHPRARKPATTTVVPFPTPATALARLPPTHPAVIDQIMREVAGYDVVRLHGEAWFSAGRVSDAHLSGGAPRLDEALRCLLCCARILDDADFPLSLVGVVA